MSAPKTAEYRNYLANLIRDYILTASGNSVDVSNAAAWSAHDVPVVDAGGEDERAVSIPGHAVPAQAQGRYDEYVYKLSQLLGVLGEVPGEQLDTEDASVSQGAHTLGMPGSGVHTYRQIAEWAVPLGRQFGLVQAPDVFANDT